MDKSFKELINNIKCGKTSSPIFTEADLANVKACLPPPPEIPTQTVKLQTTAIDSCVNEGVEEVKAIVAEQTNKQAVVMELATLRGKIQEVMDHYTIISGYYTSRYEFFNETLQKVEPLTSQYYYWTDEVDKLKNREESAYGVMTTASAVLETIKLLSDSQILTINDSLSNLSDLLVDTVALLAVSEVSARSYIEIRKARIRAESSQLTSKRGAADSLATRIQDYEPLPSDSSEVTAVLTSLCEKISGQLTPNFSNDETIEPEGVVYPARTTAFSIRLIGLNGVEITSQLLKADGSSESVKSTVSVKVNPRIDPTPFTNSISTWVYNVDLDSSPLKFSNYDFIEGALYNKTDGYPGLYNKYRRPIDQLYTPEERGLTVDPLKIDPVLKDSQVTISSLDAIFYIENQATYEKFYDELTKTLPDRLFHEQSVVFPAVISDSVTKLANFAKREVADTYRGLTDSAILLARPVSYKAGTSTVYSQGTFSYSEVDQTLSTRLSYYLKSRDEVFDKIANCKKQIQEIDTKIKENSMDDEDLAKKISAVKCFSKSVVTQNIPDCEAETMAKLGKDPFGIRTLDGNDASLPDLTTPCYWREFAKSLNKVSLLPFPDLTSPIFRYYPVNNVIPTPVGAVLVTLPQKWKPLFVLASSLGTLVGFITMPVAIVGIPLPSVYLLYLAPDGRKYMLFAPNVPILYPNSIKYGYELDQAAINPIGISGPYKGLFTKGALSIPLTISANASKAVRIAAVAADLAMGKMPQITTKDGTPIGEIDPVEYLQKYLSTFEITQSGSDSDPLKDFDKQIASFKRNINKQFDKLGDLQLNAVTKLKDATRNARQNSVFAAEDEASLSKRRKLKDAARLLDPVNLNEKINGVLDDFNQYIDKIKLGTIYFPDDPTKLNPKLPGSITGLIPILESATLGGLLKPFGSTDLLKKIRKAAADIDLDKFAGQKRFNLRKVEDLAKFKQSMNDYSKKALNYLSGLESAAEDNIDPNLPNEEKDRIAKAAALRKDRLKTALAFTSLSVATPSIKMFDPAAPCCAKPAEILSIAISPQIQAALAVFTALIEAVINGLTLDSLIAILGDAVENISITAISTLFDSIVLMLPPISLPEKPDLVAISQALMFPILSVISTPQVPNPLGIPLPVQIPIPLDEIIKPLLKAAIAYLLELILRMLSDASDLLKLSHGITDTSLDEIVKQIPCGNSQVATVSTTTSSNTVSITLPNGFKLSLPKIPMIPLDIVQYFSLLTSSDLVSLIRSLVLTAVDSILIPLKSIVDPILSIAKSLKDLSFNIIEAGNPFVSLIKLLKMAIELQIPNSTKIRIANLDAINIIRAAYIPVVKATEPVLSQVAYLGSIVACSTGPAGVTLARTAANPFFNQDDLPPWERLTHKNPLFAIFLDEIAWRSSLTSTGTLLFQTKTPGMYPTAWSPTIFTDPGGVIHASG